mmetsp:Transcript_7895/g.18366  ORF Transcript_7895/g.18366 Transcript_7895/m.18366 type:complete len:223 (-) Transcript_7895:655-1323(-)
MLSFFVAATNSRPAGSDRRRCTTVDPPWSAQCSGVLPSLSTHDSGTPSSSSLATASSSPALAASRRSATQRIAPLAASLATKESTSSQSSFASESFILGGGRVWWLRIRSAASSRSGLFSALVSADTPVLSSWKGSPPASSRVRITSRSVSSARCMTLYPISSVPWMMAPGWAARKLISPKLRPNTAICSGASPIAFTTRDAGGSDKGTRVRSSSVLPATVA